jgi:FPC/CPF motif-containing protein YcgG
MAIAAMSCSKISSWFVLCRPAEAVSERVLHERLRSLILSDVHPCVGARSAFNSNSYRVDNYQELGSNSKIDALAHGLCAFVRELPPFGTVMRLL